MNKKFTFLISSLFVVSAAFAQTFSHGDISISFQHAAMHDSSKCMSVDTATTVITIQNSFAGDEVKLMRPSQGFIIYTLTNNTGQTPWIITNPQFISGPQYREDYYIVGDTTDFYFVDWKIISGFDSLVLNFRHRYPVTDACLYDTVRGKIFSDFNGNCVYDAGDAPVVDIIPEIHPNIVGGNGYGGYIFMPSDQSGNYFALLQESWLTSFSVNFSSAFQFVLSPGSCQSVYNYTTLPQSHVDFALTCTSNVDVQGYATSTGAVRPLRPFILRPVATNTGCDAVSGTLTVTLDPRVSYNAGLSTNPATTVNGNTLSWNYIDLSVLSNLVYGNYTNACEAGLYLTPNGSLNIGDTLCFTIATTVPGNDVDASNNTYTLCLPVVNSFDPNLKEVEPKGEGTAGNIPPSTMELSYTIHFQNTGTAMAIDISIIDTLDNDIQAESLQILGASHSMVPEWLSSNVVKFNFSDIFLADSLHNEPESHGMVKFKVRLNNGLTIGTQIKNKAGIYFDNNAPIYTNTTLNTIANIAGVEEVGNQNPEIKMYPNPAAASVIISVPEELRNSALTVTDITGKEMLRTVVQGRSQQLDVRNFPNGIYFVSLRKQGTMVTQKLAVNW